MTERRLIVTRHAVAAYSRRRNDHRSLKALADVDWRLNILKRRGYGTEDLKRLIRFYEELVLEIKECVSDALSRGLETPYKPHGFVLYRRKKNTLPEGQVFVRCDEDSNYGFIVKRGEEEDVVVTTLTKAGVRR